MSETITESSDTHVDHHAHPTEGQYWWVFIFLAVVTAIEIAWSELDVFSGPALVVPLIIMMVFKFAVIAGVFMHLYFDNKILHGKVFYLCFGAGLLLAVVVFIIVFAAFEFAI